MPLTLSKADGVGALQFSVATYKEGSRPNIDVAALVSMLNEFAETKSLGRLSDQLQTQEDFALVAASFKMDENAHGRIWYISDSCNLAKITYVCEQELPYSELQEVEQIVRSLLFSLSDA